LNLAFTKKFTDDHISISRTMLNELTKVYDNGFYKYKLLQACDDCSDNKPFEFKVASDINPLPFMNSR
jgi:hypothetical protein